MAVIKDEILTFNKGLDLEPIGEPHWLTSREKRMDPNQLHGSIIISFRKEEDARKAIRNRLQIAGISARVEKLHSTSPLTQCTNCWGFGHLPQYCKRTPTCRICAKEHATQQHHCPTCQSAGKPCQHTTFKCANCGGSHSADSKRCELSPSHATEKA